MRVLRSELLLYICNHVINTLPSRRLRLLFYRKVMGFSIGERSFIFLGTTFDSRHGLSISPSSVVNEDCRLDTRGGISIGRNVSISAGVCILTADHDPNSSEFSGRLRPVVIEDRAWIGTRAMVLPGVRIGEGAIVGAGSIVTKDVLPYTIVAGNPAKELRKRPQNLSYVIEYGRLFH